jgi:hypothetical protein
LAARKKFHEGRMRLWIFAVFALGCDVSPAERITDQELQPGLSYDAPQVAYVGGQPVVAFYNPGSVLHYRALETDGEGTVLESRGAPHFLNSFVALEAQGDHVYALWRPKVARAIEGRSVGAKHIRFTASFDGGKHFLEPRRLNDDTGAFYPESFSYGAQGHLHVVWEDERRGRKGIYYNRSRDGGKTWLSHDLRMDNLSGPYRPPKKAMKQDSPQPFPESAAGGAMDAFVIEHEGRVIVGWLESYPQNQNLLKIRVSDDGGDEWCKVQVLPTGESYVFNPQIRRIKDALVIFFYGREDGIFTLRSHDVGRTWQGPELIPNTEVLGGQGYSIAHNESGQVCLAWPGPNTLNRRKADVFASCSQDGGVTWSSRPMRLDSDRKRSNHSLLPTARMDSAGRIAVIWRDSRNIRPDVYLRYSLDGGQTWNSRDIRVNGEPGRHFSNFPTMATDGQGEFAIVWEERDDDRYEATRYLAYEKLRLPEARFAYQEERDLARDPDVPPADPDQRAERLAERVGEFWQARVDENYRRAYEMMDPFFRGRVSMLQHAGQLDRVDYIDAELLPETIRIDGNRAEVQVRATTEGKETLSIGGEAFKVPRASGVTDDKWVWLDGDWFRVYETNAGNFLPL